MVSIGTEVEKVITEMTRNRRLFTAHDITKLLRHRLDGENIRHNDVKKEVHSLYDNDDMGIYTRTQVGIGTRIAPFVYHLTHQDPNTDYSKDWVNTVIQLANNVSINPIDGSAISDDDDDDDTVGLGQTVLKASSPIKRAGRTPRRTSGNGNGVQITPALRHVAAQNNDGFQTRATTSEGRLSVPVSMLGVFGNDVHVKIDTVQKLGKSVQALTLSNDPNNSIKTYSINSDGRLRISQKFLNKIGFSKTYSVKNTANSVVIVAG
jgi:hypothetical protein